MHPKYGCNGTVSRAFPLIALIALGAFFHSTPGSAQESTVSNTELSEFPGPHRVPGRELSEFLSAYYLCAKANSPSFSQNSPSLPQNSVRLSEFSSPKQYSRNSISPVSLPNKEREEERRKYGTHD